MWDLVWIGEISRFLNVLHPSDIPHCISIVDLGGTSTDYSQSDSWNIAYGKTIEIRPNYIYICLVSKMELKEKVKDVSNTLSTTECSGYFKDITLLDWVAYSAETWNLEEMWSSTRDGFFTIMYTHVLDTTTPSWSTQQIICEFFTDMVHHGISPQFVDLTQ